MQAFESIGPCDEPNQQSYLFVMPFMNQSKLLLHYIHSYVVIIDRLCIQRALMNSSRQIANAC